MKTLSGDTLLNINTSAGLILEGLDLPVCLADSNFVIINSSPAFYRCFPEFEASEISRNKVSPEFRLLINRHKKEVKSIARFSAKYENNQGKWLIGFKPVNDELARLFWVFTAQEDRESRVTTINAGNSVNDLPVIGNENPIDRLIKESDNKSLPENELYRLIAFSSSDMIAIHDVDGNFRYLSPSTQQLTHIAPSELIGKSFYAYIHPEERKNVYDIIHRGESFDDNLRAEYRLRKKDGTYIWVESAFTITIDENQNINGFHSATRDITLRQLNESRLRDQYELIRNILNLLPNSIYITDLFGNILFAGKKFCEIINLSEDEITGHTLNNFIDRVPDLAEIDAFDEQARKNQVIQDQSEKIVFNDGRKKHFYISRNLINRDTNSRCLLTIMTDITQIVQSEIRLTELNEELKNFVYKASHDLKGPLSSIIGITNLGVTNELENDPGKLFSFIRERTLRLSDLLDELLRSAHITGEKNNRTEIGFGRLVETITEELSHKPYFKNYTIRLEDKTTEPFYENAGIINSIFQNLMDNAAKYQRKDLPGILLIEITNEGRDFKIRFQDNGRGVSEDAAKKIFQKFFRVGEEEDGSGLGLYIVNQTIQKLGGTITVESDGKNGTLFQIELYNRLNN